MTRIELNKLIWEDWNVKHVLDRHSLSKKDVEKAISNTIAHRHGYKGRVILICKLKNKFISIVIDKKWTGQYYVVTARPADKHERKLTNKRQ